MSVICRFGSHDERCLFVWRWKIRRRKEGCFSLFSQSHSLSDHVIWNQSNERGRAGGNTGRVINLNLTPSTLKQIFKLLLFFIVENLLIRNTSKVQVEFWVPLRVSRDVGRKGKLPVRCVPSRKHKRETWPIVQCSLVNLIQCRVTRSDCRSSSKNLRPVVTETGPP